MGSASWHPPRSEGAWGWAKTAGRVPEAGQAPPASFFAVDATIPSSGATGVSVTVNISVTFNQDVDSGTLNTITFGVSGGGGGVSGTVTYDPASRRATFDPTVNLATVTNYTVTLSSSILSQATGDPLLETSFTFTTGTTADTTPPTFAGADSAVAGNGITVKVSWTAATDDFDTSASIVYRVYWATVFGGQDFSAPIVTTAAGATSYADFGLADSTAYFYVVRAVDSSGNEDSNTVERAVTTPARRSWAGDVYPLLNPACTSIGCHGGASGGLTLNPIGTAYAELVSVTSSLDGGCSPLLRVDPGASAQSHMFKKLEGTQGCGFQMPLGAPAFSAADLDTVRDWIDEGAIDN